jgi:hypothetical protein
VLSTLQWVRPCADSPFVSAHLRMQGWQNLCPHPNVAVSTERLSAQMLHSSGACAGGVSYDNADICPVPSHAHKQRPGTSDESVSQIESAITSHHWSRRGLRSPRSDLFMRGEKDRSSSAWANIKLRQVQQHGDHRQVLLGHSKVRVVANTFA